jgi:hypothetical protein
MKVYDFNGTYHCVLDEKSDELARLGLPPVLKMSSLEVGLQDFNGANTGKTFVLRRSDDISAPDLDISYDPPNSDYASLRIITATIGLHVYGRLKQEREVTLRHSVGNLRLEVGNTTDII